ncbi:helix-turn-helix transcriptional regulator [Flavobacterium sp. ANB]|uniref:winged helix-turn-helix transcriptional regulator n=1 Tax=unclassified Flavobacterium TaxID=196869 RepID=UPI0012B6ADA1|nr:MULTISPECIES: helix-turn-helix domain-containing protein [unclassified Flavobacterium]MBF4515876.1 helix-turn-helix transcriptional regulator [Flavobacterium sp. ANB]MTD68878.1 transcriptional regulator [Flavobacterium sp. LC2016-13]
MYQKKIPVRTECGLHLFKELLSGKWKLMLIYYISEGIIRPGVLQKKIAADRRVMTKQLDELVQDGFITKCSYETKIPKVEYQLTALGNSLLPLIMTLEIWGENNREVLESALSGKVLPNH